MRTLIYKATYMQHFPYHRQSRIYPRISDACSWKLFVLPVYDEIRFTHNLYPYARDLNDRPVLCMYTMCHEPSQTDTTQRCPALYRV